MTGQLASTLMEHMDLPQEYAQKQYNDLRAQYGANPESRTLDQLRDILADHLQTVLLELKEKGDCT